MSVFGCRKEEGIHNAAERSAGEATAADHVAAGPTTEKATSLECVQVTRHAARLFADAIHSAKPELKPAERDKVQEQVYEIGWCLEKLSKRQISCVLAAQTIGDLQPCGWNVSDANERERQKVCNDLVFDGKSSSALAAQCTWVNEQGKPVAYPRR